jgi:hypothetical protein
MPPGAHANIAFIFFSSLSKLTPALANSKAANIHVGWHQLIDAPETTHTAK